MAEMNGATPLQAIIDQNAPSAPSPLNPATLSRQASRTPAPPIQREQREKKESLKKRESMGNLDDKKPTSSSLGKRKASAQHTYPSPMRFSVPPPKAEAFEEPKEDSMVSHEPFPLTIPGSERQLYKPIDLAENKRGYRYSRAIADPQFPHKQYYRSTSPPPHYARLSFEDADKWMHFTTNALITTNEKGWRMVRSNVCAREGTLYYEIKVHRGVSKEGPDPDANGPEPHIRFGWARREAPLDAPVGFDGYSYGITDIRFETMHRSRPGKFYNAKKNKSKAAKNVPTPVVLAPEDQHVKEGDVIGVEIQLPSLSLHRKVVDGIYNHAVDTGDGFDQGLHQDADTQPMDIIRDRIPVAYKGNSYFEVLDHVISKPMEIYADRTTNLNHLPTTGPSSNKESIKTAPNPHNEYPALRTLPHSAIRVYKNGKLIGTAFENLLAFLPPASVPSKPMGGREGFDDGLGFWAPPAHLRNTKDAGQRPAQGPDHAMPDAGADASGHNNGWNPGRQLRGIGERYKEQVAEDILWDIIDEADFFVQDGGFEGTVGSGAAGDERAPVKGSRLKEED
ncbi:hypothetical protein BST61_g466 [Cercospora zeina]